ncbi:MAG TPA: HIT family protein [Gammaproteobacteria bacterium]|nr:HIT family protein [Gammaproteobacteria bacterium]
MMKQQCLFCERSKLGLIEENSLSYAIRDKYPVMKLHTLILSKKHYENIFVLPAEELVSIFELAMICQEKILKEDDSVKGFNFGSNSGEVAGQKIDHVHFHLIPRRIGDTDPPPAQCNR